MYHLLLLGASLGLTAAAAPGAFQAFLISESLAGGWRRAAPIALAPLITDAPIGLLVLLVLGQLAPAAIRVLNVAGGLFALYLAWGLWRGWRAGAEADGPGEASTRAAPEAVKDSRRVSGLAGLRKGVLMNLLSPGPYTFWALVIGPIVLPALRESPWHGAMFLAGFYALLVGGMLALAAAFGQARRLGPRVVRGLLLASMVILAAFGVTLIGRGVTG